MALALCAGTCAAASPDLFVGTQGLGHVSPAAAWPFGMIQAGPDTSSSPDRYVGDWAHTYLGPWADNDFTEGNSWQYSWHVTRLNTFTVIARNLSRENKYVKSVTLNGKPITAWKIRHADIMRWNFLPDFSRHFNNMRTYCAGAESGLLMGSWPRGRLKTPFPYFGEVMTGFEYVAAAEMIFQGMDADAVKVVKSVRDRHDGLKRNPFSEPECGHNYARSMASWNCLVAWLKMHGGGLGELVSKEEKRCTSEP